MRWRTGIDIVTGGPARRSRALDRDLEAFLLDPGLSRQGGGRRRASRRPPTATRVAIRSRRARPRGVSPLFLGLVLATSAAAATAWSVSPNSPTARVAVFALVVGGWLVSLCLHEFAHALVGYRAGDDTVLASGYLTLNPMRYGHPVLTVLIPLLVLVAGGLALPGGAVSLQPHRFRSRAWDSAVSAAGPAVNLLVAALVGLVLHLRVDGPGHAAFWAGLAFLGYLQLSVALFNLLPIPGLDGWGIWEPYCSAAVRRAVAPLRPFGFLMLFGLLSVPSIGSAAAEGIARLAESVGLPAAWWMPGAWLFQFWRS